MGRVFFVAMCLAVGAVLVGCEKKSPPPTTTQPADKGSYGNPPNSVDTGSPTTRPDNTGVNVRDRGWDKTADNAGQGKKDVQLAADIRKRVMESQMSSDAKNAKIVVQDGKVTLRGPVKNQEEKDSIGRIAADLAGAANVDNQLEVQSNP